MNESQSKLENFSSTSNSNGIMQAMLEMIKSQQKMSLKLERDTLFEKKGWGKHGVVIS